MSVGSDGEKRGGVAVENVREEIELPVVPLVVDFGVAEHRPTLDLEGPDSGVHDALAASDSSGKDELLSGVGKVIIHAGVELRLHGAVVGERRIGCLKVVGNGSGGPGKSVHGTHARGDLVRPAIVHGFRVGGAHAKRAARVELIALDVAVHSSESDRHRSSIELAGRLGDDVHDTGHRVGTPDGRCRSPNHFDLRDLARVDGEEIPCHEAEEVLIDGTTIEQRELRSGERRSSPPGCEVDVAGRDLGDVDTRNRPQEVAVVLSG